MIKYMGFLYGNYDSRGGTVFVQAASREEADQIYIEKLWGTKEGDNSGKSSIPWDIALRATAEHFLGPAVLSSQVELVDGQDIDGDDDTERDENEDGVPVYKSGAVSVLKGFKGTCDDFPESDGAFEILYLSNGPIPDGYAEPRWNDDAFGLLFVTNLASL